MSVEESPGSSGASGSCGAQPEDLLAWVAGYAVELSRLGGGPLRRVAVACAETRVEVEWAPPERSTVPVPIGRAESNGAAGSNGAKGFTASGGSTGAGAVKAGGGDGADDTRIVVASPMVGTFYRAPEPGAAPYVEVGDLVEAGQQVGIVEAMKLMNPILAERPGRVVEIAAGDGEPVEYDQPLIVLVPSDGHADGR